MPAPSFDYGLDPPLDGREPGIMFKKHKVLPHPRTNTSPETDPKYPPRSRATRRPGGKASLIVDETRPLPRLPDPNRQPSSQPSTATSPRTLKHHYRQIDSLPDPPPTPPAHSRTSSGSQSALPSSPNHAAGSNPSDESTRKAVLATPPNEKSPPTPDVTPPGFPVRPRALQQTPTDRERQIVSRSTTDSRTGSFKTAREEPYTSGEEDARTALRSLLTSARTSRNTVRYAPEPSTTPRRAAADTSNTSSPDSHQTPRAKREFISFDGEWPSGDEVHDEWDDNLQRLVTVRNRADTPDTPRLGPRRTPDLMEDPIMSASTSVTTPARPLFNHGRPDIYSSPKSSVSRPRVRGGHAPSESSSSVDARRFSGISSSTVVEAILVDAPPKRQRTLRHVRKQLTLRDLHAASGSPNGDALPPTTRISSAPAPETSRRSRPAEQKKTMAPPRHENRTSTSTVGSIPNGRARREVLRNGGIPVVVVPERRSSIHSREPSLRSTSSHRSKRSASLHSIPLLASDRDLDTPIFERRSRRRSRPLSESETSDQRTMDYAPVVPKRTSSLSAPTSRNTSRAGSLTAESLRAHDALQAHQSQKAFHDAVAVLGEPKAPLVGVASDDAPLPQKETSERPSHLSQSQVVDGAPHHSPRSESELEGSGRQLSIDRTSDLVFGRRLSVRNTPFSLASMDTNGTAPEVSEALVVNIYTHQNSSVVMVDHHSTKRSEESDVSRDASIAGPAPITNPKIMATEPDCDEPCTPPQPQFSMDDVESPLRNPREAPEPPAGPPVIAFIPATPSGLTPFPEKQNQLGNFFDAAEESKPPRSRSLVRRAFSRRRHSISGPPPSRRPSFLTRTLSLTRNLGRVPAQSRGGGNTVDYDGPALEEPPADGDRLHPFWRPAYPDVFGDGASDGEDEERSAGEAYYRYPPIDNRPRRSLSQRVKRTFAVLPIRDELDLYTTGDERGPDRRTIRRTASGNLRVMRHRASLDSVRPSTAHDEIRPYSAPENHDVPFWRGHDYDGRGNNAIKKSGFFPMLSSRFEDLQALPRRFSQRRREKRAQELRQKISGPRKVRDGVEDVVRSQSYRNPPEDRSGGAV